MFDIGKGFDLDNPIAGRERIERWAGAAAVVLLLIIFFSSWWNRYLSPTAGVNITNVFLNRMGWLPYRDYFASVPPGITILDLAIADVFGNRLIVFWTFGAAFRLLGALFGYIWLSRIVRPAWAAFAVVCTFVLASLDIADTPYFYHHIPSTFCLLAGLALTGTFEGSWKRRFAFGALGGLMMSGAVLLKQTTAVIAFSTFIGVLFVLFGSKREWRKLGVAVGSFGLGVAIPVVSAFFWLSAKGIMPDFIDQVFVRGPSSKGGALASLMRPLTLTFRVGALVESVMICFVLLGIGWYAYFRNKSENDSFSRYWWLALVAFFGVLIVGRHTGIVPMDLRTFYLAFAYLALFGCGSICLWAAVSLFLPDRRVLGSPDIVLMSAVGFACAYSLSLSWPAYEVMIFPGAALLAALALEWGGPAKLSTVFRSVTVAFMLVLVVTAVARKHNAPFYWGRWTEPPLEYSTTEPRTAELKGFVLSQWTANYLDDVTETIQKFAQPEDRIFVYPNMPIVYALAHRLPVTFGLNHWIDICPDYVAVIDADRLLKTPPAVIVIHPDMPQEIAAEEMLFRDGRRSSVRDVLTALETIYPRYKVVRMFQVPGHPEPIQVWALKR